MITFIIFLLVLSLLVFVHELGHFLTAKKLGVKPEEFGFGFPPRLVGFYKNRLGHKKIVWGSKEVDDSAGTIYSLNWIPLGGFVKIKGENGDNNDDDSFINKPVWKRTIILSSGVLMNIILAMVLLSIGFMIGLPQSVDSSNNNDKISNKQIQIIQIINESPANKANLKVGDIISSVDNIKFNNYSELQSYVDKNKGKELEYKIKRGNEEVTKIIVPELIKDTGKGGIGVAISEIGIVKYSFFKAVWEGIKATIFLTWAILVAFYELFMNIFSGKGVGADVAGPVGIAVITGQVARLGIIYLLQFTALLSINLAIVNFIPFPALDGGRVLFLIIEKIKGKPVRREVEAIMHNIGFILLLLLVVIITFKDVLKYVNFKMIFSRFIG